MRTRRVYTVGDDAGMAASAEKLGQVFYPMQHTQAVNVSREKCFDGLHDDELESLVFLGHANLHEYGDYDAKGFAKQLERQFRHMKDKKQLVKHVYLIGCDMGVIQEDGRSLAQSIADELERSGFPHVQVHSVAQPEGAIGESMYVEVITRAGVLRTLDQVKEGYLNAYLFSQQDGDHFFELLKDKRKNAAAIDRFKEEHAFVFLKAANPVEELNKPHNIFLPRESPRTRLQRITENPQTQMSVEQMRAIALLRARRDYECDKNKKSLVRKLDFIITQISRAQPQEWQGLLSQYKSYLEIKFAGLLLNKKSNTLKLLTHLGLGQFDQAQHLIDGQKLDKKHQKRKDKTEKQHRDVTSHTRKREEVSQLPLPDSSPRLFDHRSKRKQVAEDDAPVTVNDNKESLSDMLKVIKAKEKINALIIDLNAEILELSSGCFSFFHSYEITTKTKKRDALMSLTNEKNLKGLQMQASTYMLSDSRVMRSMKTTRTRDLLDTIVNHPEKLIQEAREDVMNRHKIN
ncbi:hypothetical protein AQUSIP_17990 [Aquicella siphonis]|uniref:Uncharacterized protein n=1 Tax=Aquicella siphonis TaxID=254247 RepID=A0A5E4PJL2_9COXI|nr:hypothetical protein [Aquicella siphonis]VVC76486.1 hypothetical protein AQUSIP_17990 [Aquicella siphonis]